MSVNVDTKKKNEERGVKCPLLTQKYGHLMRRNSLNTGGFICVGGFCNFFSETKKCNCLKCGGSVRWYCPLCEAHYTKTYRVRHNWNIHQIPTRADRARMQLQNKANPTPIDNGETSPSIRGTKRSQPQPERASKRPTHCTSVLKDFVQDNNTNNTQTTNLIDNNTNFQINNPFLNNIDFTNINNFNNVNNIPNINNDYSFANINIINDFNNGNMNFLNTTTNDMNNNFNYNINNNFNIANYTNIYDNNNFSTQTQIFNFDNSIAYINENNNINYNLTYNNNNTLENSYINNNTYTNTNNDITNGNFINPFSFQARENVFMFTESPMNFLVNGELPEQAVPEFRTPPFFTEDTDEDEAFRMLNDQVLRKEDLFMQSTGLRASIAFQS